MNMPPLRIALILKTTTGGLWIVPHVKEMIRRGHRVTVVLPPGRGRLRDALAEIDVPVLSAPFDFRFRFTVRTLRGLWELRGQIRRLRPDVVHYHLYASALAARLSTVGLPVSRVHMVAGPLYLESPVIRWAERFLVRLDHVTIGGSAHTSRAYRALGLPAARTPSVPYGVDTEVFAVPSPTARAAARAALGIAADAFVVVMVAYVYAPKRSVHRGRGIKGHDVLLEAWTRFAPTAERSFLLLVGGGFDRGGERYRAELINRYGVDADARVEWRPTVDDVRGYYAAADLSVSPSLSENHGAALEAGAAGVPCVVSDAGALPETVDADCGWVVPRGDARALAAALTLAYREWCVGALPRRGRAARRRVTELFDRQAASARVVDIIERSRLARRAGPVSAGNAMEERP